SHVTATTVGTKARVKNSDGILHNTHGFLAKVTVFNLALPNRDQMIDITKRLTKPGVVRVLCDAHPHIFALMIVQDGAYVAVEGVNRDLKVVAVPAFPFKATLRTAFVRPAGLNTVVCATCPEARAIPTVGTTAAGGMVLRDFNLLLVRPGHVSL